jgi:hypothetical protein
MIASSAIFGAFLCVQATAGAANPVYDEIAARGFVVGTARAAVPVPTLRGTESAREERAALGEVAGSDGAVEELIRDSVTAPFRLKTRDVPAGDLGVIRAVDLWFVVCVSLDDIDPAGLAAGGREGRTVEAGNMRFGAARLGNGNLTALGIKPDEGREWFIHSTGRLLDRIDVEATDRLTASRTEDSWLIAWTTDPRFDGDRAHPNRWRSLTRESGGDRAGPSHKYPGGAGFVKLSRLKSVPGALLVEAHAAFFEPKDWFENRPILKSKIGVVAQDRVRGLRRELARAKSRRQPGGRTAPGAGGG